MKLLAIETATEACSVALWVDGALSERFEVAPRRHAELVLPWSEALMAEAGVARTQLDAIAVSRGPGAFTGVRLAVAIAQGIALALDRPVVAPSTLQVLAATALPAVFAVDADDDAVVVAGQRVLAAIDARMGEVYAGAFAWDGEYLRACSAETVSAPDQVGLPEGEGAWLGVGTGFAAEGGRLAQRLHGRLARVDATALPRAAHLARLSAAGYARGEAVPADRLEPAYLRNAVALTLAEQRAGKGA
jgi:tRNA threonylcarbamoyladenosine biosynthesis protein TsaB